jgi:hypothetical protein
MLHQRLLSLLCSLRYSIFSFARLIAPIDSKSNNKFLKKSILKNMDSGVNLIPLCIATSARISRSSTDRRALPLMPRGSAANLAVANCLTAFLINTRYDELEGIVEEDESPLKKKYAWPSRKAETCRADHLSEFFRTFTLCCQDQVEKEF